MDNLESVKESIRNFKKACDTYFNIVNGLNEIQMLKKNKMLKELGGVFELWARKRAVNGRGFSYEFICSFDNENSFYSYLFQ